MSGKWTAGPWEVQYLTHADGELWLQIGSGGRGPITEVNGGAVEMRSGVAEMKYLITPENEQRANAALIAAAPELAEAVHQLLWLANDREWEEDSPELEYARDALRKAGALDA